MNWQDGNHETQTNVGIKDLALTETISETVNGGSGAGRDILIAELGTDRAALPQLSASLTDLPLTNAAQVRGGGGLQKAGCGNLLLTTSHAS